jgi:hypothetical protein
VLQGKIWAVSEDTRRPTKRRKDLLDIERLLENYPHLRERVAFRPRCSARYHSWEGVFPPHGIKIRP